MLGEALDEGTSFFKSARVRNAIPVLIADGGEAEAVTKKERDLLPLLGVFTGWRLEAAGGPVSVLAAFGTRESQRRVLRTSLERLSTGEADVRDPVRWKCDG